MNVHEPTVVPELRPLEFLLGEFRGTAVREDGTAFCHRELSGTWAVHGRFLALRLTALYPMADGRLDNHAAFIVLGAAPAGALEARAYTDAGESRDYTVALDGDALVFDDRPGAAKLGPAKDARKILRPTPYGFEERLEIDRGDGFKPYYIAEMRRAVPGDPSL